MKKVVIVLLTFPEVLYNNNVAIKFWGRKGGFETERSSVGGSDRTFCGSDEPIGGNGRSSVRNGRSFVLNGRSFGHNGKSFGSTEKASSILAIQ